MRGIFYCTVNEHDPNQDLIAQAGAIDGRVALPPGKEVFFFFSFLWSPRKKVG